MDFLHDFRKSTNHRKICDSSIHDNVMCTEESIISAADLSLTLSVILVSVFLNRSTHVD